MVTGQPGDLRVLEMKQSHLETRLSRRLQDHAARLLDGYESSLELSPHTMKTCLFPLDARRIDMRIVLGRRHQLDRPAEMRSCFLELPSVDQDGREIMVHARRSEVLRPCPGQLKLEGFPEQLFGGLQISCLPRETPVMELHLRQIPTPGAADLQEARREIQVDGGCTLIVSQRLIRLRDVPLVAKDAPVLWSEQIEKPLATGLEDRQGQGLGCGLISPTICEISVSRSGNDIVVSWSADPGRRVVIYDVKSCGDRVVVGTVEGTTSFLHEGAALSPTPFNYRVTNVNACGEEIDFCGTTNCP